MRMNHPKSTIQAGIFGARGRRVRRILCVLIVALSTGIASSAQNQRPAPLPSSDLGRDNLSRVAASATELKAVLLKDAGLLVELKRWVAKDATDHGQIISDSDLTNDAIFERLESDIQFRSIATGIVQRYGYLLPRVNPESELGKERELLIQERTKWLAQHQEEELAAARQQNARNLQYARACDPQLDGGCESAPPNSSLTSEGARGRHGAEGQQPPNAIPEQSNSPAYPREGPNPRERERVIQTDAETTGNYPQDQFGNRNEYGQIFSGLDVNFDGGNSGGSLQQVSVNGETEPTGAAAGGGTFANGGGRDVAAGNGLEQGVSSASLSGARQPNGNRETNSY